jgi:hypothetical protein
MDAKFCFSCAMPLNADTQTTPGEYCKHCTTADGKLKPREEVTQGLVQWMKMWQPSIDHAKALVRTKAYMSSMPAWAE